MSHERSLLGAAGELHVAAYLQKNGFTIQAMNYATRTGEIDIIALKNDILAFVEVKLRQTEYFNISEIITYSKQRKIITTALRYLSQHRYTQVSYRFDVALLTKKEETFNLTYIPNAFTASAVI